MIGERANRSPATTASVEFGVVRAGSSFLYFEQASQQIHSTVYRFVYLSPALVRDIPTKMMFFALASALAAISAVSAQTTITVQVGANGGLTYEPSSVNASQGDTIAFQFLAKNHTVTQSTFANPCTASGVDSGFFPVTANATEVPQWSFTVNNASAPLWFFCAQTGHCERGMVFAVNPTAERTFEAFQAAAMSTASNTSATGSATGGATASASGSGADATATTATSGALPRLSFNNAASALAVVGVLASFVL
ncbi:hypothetical protein ACEPAI_4998 [Sanghuangporus weigelae]